MTLLRGADISVRDTGRGKASSPLHFRDTQTHSYTHNDTSALPPDSHAWKNTSVAPGIHTKQSLPTQTNEMSLFAIIKRL